MAVRETTLFKAVQVMEEALKVYADGKWNHNYPGGIDLWPNDDRLEMGDSARSALRHPSVKRAIEASRKSVQ